MIKLMKNLGKEYCRNLEESNEFLFDQGLESQFENDFEEFKFYLKSFSTEES